nr:hypothetical protein [Paraburkholderia kirstenboschensis]
MMDLFGVVSLSNRQFGVTNYIAGFFFFFFFAVVSAEFWIRLVNSLRCSSEKSARHFLPAAGFCGSTCSTDGDRKAYGRRDRGTESPTGEASTE